jgi:hypothetical protein
MLTPDELLCALITSFPDKMLTVHQMTIKRLRGATDQLTVKALELAGAPVASAMMGKLLRL